MRLRVCIQPLFTVFGVVKANLKTFKNRFYTLTGLSTRKPLNEIFSRDTVARQRHRDKGQTVYRLLCRRPILHASSRGKSRGRSSANRSYPRGSVGESKSRPQREPTRFATTTFVFPRTHTNTARWLPPSLIRPVNACSAQVTTRRLSCDKWPPLPP